MSSLAGMEQLESQLRAELHEAEQQLRNATPQQKDEARKRFKEALRNFTRVALEGKVPLILVRKP